MLRKILVFAVLAILALHHPSARGDLIVEFDNVTFPTRSRGAVDVFVSSTGSDSVALFNTRFAITRIGGSGILEFLPTYIPGSTDTQSNSEIAEPTYLFNGASGFFASQRSDPVRSELTQSDFSAGGATVGAGRLLLGRLELEQISPVDIAGEYRITLVRDVGNTFFRQSDFVTSVGIDEASYTNFGTISITAVPEPGTVGVLGMAGIATLLIRRRKR